MPHTIPETNLTDHEWEVLHNVLKAEVRLLHGLKEEIAKNSASFRMIENKQAAVVTLMVKLGV